MKKIMSFVMKASAGLAPMALALATLTANSTCICFTYQPDVPAKLAAKNAK